MIRTPRYHDSEGHERSSDRWAPGDIEHGRPIEDLLPITTTGIGIACDWSRLARDIDPDLGVATVNLKVHDHDSGVAIDLNLQRKEVNRMLQVLRMARNEHFGPDE